PAAAPARIKAEQLNRRWARQAAFTLSDLRVPAHHFQRFVAEEHLQVEQIAGVRLQIRDRERVPEAMDGRPRNASEAPPANDEVVDVLPVQRFAIARIEQPDRMPGLLVQVELERMARPHVEIDEAFLVALPENAGPPGDEIEIVANLDAARLLSAHAGVEQEIQERTIPDPVWTALDHVAHRPDLVLGVRHDDA